MDMTENIRIRKMEMDDISQVCLIEEEMFAKPWSRESFVDEINRNVCARYFVAVYNDVIVGYGGVWLVITDANITNVAVKKDMQGHGIGTMVIKRLMQCAYDELEITNITLEVRRSNYKAQGLYRKLGFLVEGIRSKYYSDNNEDAYMMWCRDTSKYIIHD